MISFLSNHPNIACRAWGLPPLQFVLEHKKFLLPSPTAKMPYLRFLDELSCNPSEKAAGFKGTAFPRLFRAKGNPPAYSQHPGDIPQLCLIFYTIRDIFIVLYGNGHVKLQVVYELPANKYIPVKICEQTARKTPNAPQGAANFISEYFGLLSLILSGRY